MKKAALGHPERPRDLCQRLLENLYLFALAVYRLLDLYRFPRTQSLRSVVDRRDHWHCAASILILILSQGDARRSAGKGSLLWLLLLAVCVGFTCVLPAYLAWQPATYLAGKLKTDASFARIMVIDLSAYIYTRYNFHEKTALKMAQGAFLTSFNLLQMIRSCSLTCCGMRRNYKEVSGFCSSFGS